MFMLEIQVTPAINDHIQPFQRSSAKFLDIRIGTSPLIYIHHYPRSK